MSEMTRVFTIDVDTKKSYKFDMDLSNFEGGGGTGGTTNYNNLTNLPKLNGITIKGNLTTDDLGLNQVSIGAIPTTGEEGVLYISPTGTLSIWNGSAFTSVGGSTTQPIIFVSALPITGVINTLYVNTTSDALFYWDGSDFVKLASGGGTGGTTDHSELDNLDFEHSGHTGFAKQSDLEAIDGRLTELEDNPSSDRIFKYTKYTEYSEGDFVWVNRPDNVTLMALVKSDYVSSNLTDELTSFLQDVLNNKLSMVGIPMDWGDW